MYDDVGTLQHYPIEGEHIRSLRTKSQVGPIRTLIQEGISQQFGEASDVATSKTISKKKAQVDSPKSLLLSFVQELVATAVEIGDDKISARSSRKLHRLVLLCVDYAAKELLASALEKYANAKETSETTFMSPDKVASGATGIDVLVTPSSTTVEDSLAPPIEEFETIEVVDVDEDDDDESMVTAATATTTDDFISDLKEEIILQSLLYRRIHEKKERVFSLLHRNGRRLLVVLPPDAQSVATFEEEANRTKWVDTMLNNDDRVEGMLSYLAKTQPDIYEQVGQKRKLSMRTVALNTEQTISLARVCRLNDVRLKKLRSFMRVVGKG